MPPISSSNSIIQSLTLPVSVVQHDSADCDRGCYSHNQNCQVSTMPLRALLRYLLNNEQLIQKIAESYPIRRAAQLTAYFFQKGKEIGGEKLEQWKETDAVNRLQDELKHSSRIVQDQANKSIQKTNSFINSFAKNLSEEWKKAEKKLEEQKRIGKK
ncbi:hypothetical protein BgiMline_026555 [Biomphalaria glabrata]